MFHCLLASKKLSHKSSELFLLLWMHCVFLSLIAIKIFFFVFSFQQFDCYVHRCDFLVLFLLGVHWASWLCGLSFIKYIKILDQVFSNIFSAPFTPLSPFGTPVTWLLNLLTVLHVFLMLCSSLSIFLSSYLSLVFPIDLLFSSQIPFSIMSSVVLSLSKWS